ncbi:GyrI-like domain-containing protein [Skermania piniformis]|uniref:GyrI-like domain-containing protein n=1 Tax=Skermania pinensis TaxID=39122 RepID=A0ABX8S3T3_9ACTN|nr:GyrI-like domain-containing protein [Skermania piniformis]QXQ12489.1 GyrI-like domain-containing protein [Skermania piniformis]
MTADLITEQPHDSTTRIELGAMHLAVIRHEQVTIAQLPQLFDPGFTALGAAIAADRFQPTGPALAVYRSDPQQPFDLDIGFPIARPLTTPLESAGLTIEPGAVAAGPAFVLSQIGPYDGLGAAWGKLMSDVVAAGATPAVLLEVYVTQPTPTTNPAELRTDLFALLAGGQ